METVFTRLLTAALLGIFIENAAFERALGVNVLLYAARKKENLIGIFVGAIYVTTVSSAIICFTDRYFSSWEYYNIMIPFIYILVVSAVYLLTLMAVWKFFPKIFRRVKKYVHLSVFNCAVLGALFIQSQIGGTFASYVGYGVGTGLGFLLAGYLIFAAEDRLNSESVPAAFRGMPVTMIYIGIISLALSAFWS
ncbi:MAG: hypothetical protein NC203_06775 [Firmicutes bacterium]|nr:hypothetical protein [[Eubacterium] siraeum]MCM1488051.1 hypothetical protein [Bacillota bacterium]